MLPLDLTVALPAWSRPLVSGLGAFLLTVALTPLVIRLAHRVGWVARPTEDRWHERPTALMGGLPIFLGATTGLLLVPGSGGLWGLWAGATVLFLAGLADDFSEFAPVGKIVTQVAGATILLVAGYELAPTWPFWLSVSLTYFWVIGITNAVNLLDNMDGLAAGIAGIAAGTVALLAGVVGTWSSAGPAMAIAGAAGGFLVYNYPPARIFMGDGGSLFLGFSVAALALTHPGPGATGTAAVLVVPAAVMAVPILDTTLVTLQRITTGRPITQGGRDHSSHRLVFLGLSERRAVLTLYGVAGGFSGLAVAFRLFNVYLTLAVAAVAAVALTVFGVFLGEVRVADPTSSEPGQGDSEVSDGEDRVLLRAVVRNKREIAGLLADLLLVVGSFVTAHYLRFEAGLSQAHLDRMVALLPFVVLLKIGTLYAFGAYRGMLRYAGSHELITVAKASSTASALLVLGLVLAFRFEGFSRSVFVIDWLLASLSLAAVRGAFRGLRGYFASKRRRGDRVLLYGAGDAGYLALREIQQNPDLEFIPVGFLDDDSWKQGRVLHGLPVLGGSEDLDEIASDRSVDGVIVTISSGLASERREAVAGACRRLGLRMQRMRIDFAQEGDA